MYADQCSINITQISSPAPYLQATEDSCYWNPPPPPPFSTIKIVRDQFISIYIIQTLWVSILQKTAHAHQEM